MSAPTQASREAAERIARMLREHPALCERSVADVVQSACDANDTGQYTIPAPMTKITNMRRTILDYEIRASWWAQWIGVAWLQELTGRYFGRKVNRKYARWEASKAMSRRVEAIAREDQL